MSRAWGPLVCSAQRWLEGKSHGSQQFPHEASRGTGTDLCSLLTVIGPDGMAWNCDWGGSGWISGKGSSPESGWALEQVPQGNSHSTELLALKKHLGKALSHIFWLLGDPMWIQELDAIIPVGPFYLWVFCDSTTFSVMMRAHYYRLTWSKFA